MVSSARTQSPTGVYHVMFRGINRQTIFEDDEGAERFLDILAECKAMDAWQLFGCCLMGNHVHILIGCEDRPLGDILKRIGVRYVPWFNKKYGRIGSAVSGAFPYNAR